MAEIFTAIWGFMPLRRHLKYLSASSSLAPFATRSSKNLSMSHVAIVNSDARGLCPHVHPDADPEEPRTRIGSGRNRRRAHSGTFFWWGFTLAAGGQAGRLRQGLAWVWHGSGRGVPGVAGTGRAWQGRTTGAEGGKGEAGEEGRGNFSKIIHGYEKTKKSKAPVRKIDRSILYAGGSRHIHIGVPSGPTHVKTHAQ